MSDETAIVVSGNTFIEPAASISQLRERYLVFNQFVKDVLHSGIDYAVIPGTDKPSLVKPGAEKLATLFGLSAKFEKVEKVEDWTGAEHGGEPFFYYLYRCGLYRGNLLVAECEGSCNSWEKKYRYRAADLKCPACGKSTIIKGKVEFGGGWLCFAKRGGCGAKFAENAPEIMSQPRGLIPNPDIADTVNTLQKMAQKRAFVGAVLIATNASEYFTQDIEDMPVFVDAVVSPVPEAAHVQAEDAPAKAPAPVPAPAMTLEEAQAETSSDGTPYGEIDTDSLRGRAGTIAKKLRGQITAEERAVMTRKLAAIMLIIKSREEQA